MKNLISSALCASLFLLSFSCAPNSPRGQTLTAANGSAAVSAEVKTYDLTPKVDILVVVDNSMSMLAHQENLSKNIDGFVRNFADNQLLDFHVGIVAIWDSVHFDQDIHGQVIRNHDGLGHLTQLKNPNYDPKDPTSKRYLDGSRVITKNTPNYIDVMKQTLLLGETPGPAFEEMLTPIIPALSPDLAKGDNKDFYRADANLIVIIITDGDDGKVDISPKNLADQLIALKGGDKNKVSIVGVLSPSLDKTCEKDNGGPEGPVRIEALMSAVDGPDDAKKKELDLCSKNFGADLANIGRDLSVKIPQQVIHLPNVPDHTPDLTNSVDDELIVMTGSDMMKKAVAPNFDDGWNYDPSTQNITIGSKTKITGQLKISFTPVHLYNVSHGRVTFKN